MQIEEALYDELIGYLARRPWYEVNNLIQKLAASARDRKKITTVPTVDEGR